MASRHGPLPACGSASRARVSVGQRKEVVGDRWWISASPVQLGRLSVSYPGSGGAFQKGCCQVRDRQAGQLGTHSLRHSYRSWPDAVGTECPAAEVDAAPRHPPTMNIYGDVVTDEMERAHRKSWRWLSIEAQCPTRSALQSIEQYGGESGILSRVLSDLSVFQRDVLKSFKIQTVEPRSICLFRALLSLQFTSVRPKMESKWNRNLA